MKIEHDKHLPLTKKQMAYALASAAHEAPEPEYERFVCADGPYAGRGLIVPMPADNAVGYDLFHAKEGDNLALERNHVR